MGEDWTIGTICSALLTCGETPLGSKPLVDVPLGSVPLGSDPLGDVPLGPESPTSGRLGKTLVCVERWGVGWSCAAVDIACCELITLGGAVVGPNSLWLARPGWFASSVVLADHEAGTTGSGNRKPEAGYAELIAELSAGSPTRAP